MSGTKKTVAQLEAAFAPGKVPTSANYADIFASFVHKDDQQSGGGTSGIPEDFIEFVETDETSYNMNVHAASEPEGSLDGILYTDFSENTRIVVFKPSVDCAVRCGYYGGTTVTVPQGASALFVGNSESEFYPVSGFITA